MELAFKAGLLSRFRGGWDRTGATHFQGKCHVRCTSGATIYQKRVSSVNRKQDKNKSLYLSKNSMSTHGSFPIFSHPYLLWHRVI